MFPFTAIVYVKALIFFFCQSFYSKTDFVPFCEGLAKFRLLLKIPSSWACMVSTLFLTYITPEKPPCIIRRRTK